MNAYPLGLVSTTKPTAGRAIDLLVEAGVLVETTGRKRDRSFVYQSYLDRLRVGTELDDKGSQPGSASERGAEFPRKSCDTDTNGGE